MTPTFEQFLFEIGDRSAKVYKYKITGKTNISELGSKMTAKFTTDSALKYDLHVKNVMMYADVEFSIGGEHPETNKGEIFRVMATVGEIIQLMLVASPELRGIRYDPKSKGEDAGKGRDRIYRVFIDNALKQMGRKASYIQQGGTVFATFT